MNKLDAKDLTLSIISFNTFGTPVLSPRVRQRYEKITEIINQSGANIVCLQEVSTYHHLLLLKKKMSSFPFVVYQKFLYGPKGGLVIFSKIPIENKDYISFSKMGAFRNRTIYARLLRNGVLLCKFKNHPLYIINTYLTSNFDFDWTPTNRFYPFLNIQIEEVAEIANEIAELKNQVIVTGDFNVGKNSRLYKKFLELTHAKDLFSEFSFPTYNRDRKFFLFKGKKSDRIDYIFLLNKHFKSRILNRDHIFEAPVILGRNKSRYISDHIGLKTDIHFNFLSSPRVTPEEFVSTKPPKLDNR